jgi:DNA-binding LytR/AlgR family response regulator
MDENISLRVLIVDDEPLAHEVVITYIKERDDLIVVGQCYSGPEALAFIKQTAVDLIFLDIEMPVLTGFDFLSVLTDKPQVIITSAYQEYALEGFNMDVADYLLKPFRYDRFQQAIDKVKQRLNVNIEKPNQRIRESVDLEPQSIFIKVDKKQIQIELAQVSCFEAYGNYVKVYRDLQAMLTPKTLRSFEQSLPKAIFIRVHKSTIINKTMIDFIEGDTVTLKDGKKVSIGKQYKHNLL